MANVCTVCKYPIKKANRTVHVSCAGKVQVQADDQPAPASTQRECCFCHSRDTVMINGAPFCPEHRPGDDAPRARSRETFTILGERCVRMTQITKGKHKGEWVDVGCGEPLTPTVTKGSIKCRCDEPTPPRPCKPGCAIPHMHLTEAAWLARMGKVPMQTRFGN